MEEACHCAVSAGAWYLCGLVIYVMLTAWMTMKDWYCAGFGTLMGKIAGIGYVPWLLYGAMLRYSDKDCGNIDMLGAND